MSADGTPAPTPGFVATRWTMTELPEYDRLDVYGGEFCTEPLAACEHLWRARPFIGFRGPKGSGKGEVARRLLAARGRGILVEATLGVLDQMCGRCDATFRSKWEPTDPSAHLFQAQSEGRLGLNLATLTRLAPSGRVLRDDVCIFDEAVTLLDDTAKGGDRTRRADVAQAVAHAAGTAGQLWLMDADLTESDFRCYGALARVGGRGFGSGDHRPLFIEYHAPEGPRGSVVLYRGEGRLRETGLDYLRSSASPAIYMSDSRHVLQAIDELFREDGGEMLLVTGRTRQRAQAEAWLRDPNPERAPRVGLSPAAMTGLNIKGVFGNLPAYPVTFHDVTLAPNGPLLRTSLQSLERVRCGPERHVRVPVRATTPQLTTSDALLALDMALERMTASSLGDRSQGFRRLDQLVAAREAKHALDSAEFFSTPLPESFARRGYRVAGVVRSGASPVWGSRWKGADRAERARQVREELAEEPSVLDAAGTVCETDRRTVLKVTEAVFSRASLDLPAGDAHAREDFESAHDHPEFVTTARAFYGGSQIARDVDILERSGPKGASVPALADRSNATLRDALLHEVLDLVGVGVAHLREGATFQVSSEDLAAWAPFAEANRDRLWRLLQVKAPRSERGRVATFNHAMNWIGVEVLEKHQARRGGRRLWIYVLGLSALASRRVISLGDPSATPGGHRAGTG